MNGFDCPLLVDFRIIDGCTARILVTVNRDGTLAMVDTSDHSDSAESPHAGTWNRSGRSSISVKSAGFGFEPTGEDAGTQVRTGEWTFAPDRKSFAGSSMTTIFNPDENPLDPAAVPDVTLTATISAQRLH